MYITFFYNKVWEELILFSRKNFVLKIFNGFPVAVQAFTDNAVNTGFPDVIHLTEGFAVVDVADVNLDNRGRDGFQRVGNRDRSMGKTAGI